MSTSDLSATELRNLVFVEEQGLTSGPAFEDLEPIIDRRDCPRSVLARIAARVDRATPEHLIEKLVKHPNLPIASVRAVHLTHPDVVLEHRWVNVRDPLRGALEVLSCFMNNPEETRSVEHLEATFGPLGPRALEVAIEAAREKSTKPALLTSLAVIADEIRSQDLREALLARQDLSADARHLLDKDPLESEVASVDPDAPPFEPTGPIDLEALAALDAPSTTTLEDHPRGSDESDSPQAQMVPHFARAFSEARPEEAMAMLRDFEASPDLLTYVAGHPREDVEAFRCWDVVVRHPNTPPSVRRLLIDGARSVARSIRDVR